MAIELAVGYISLVTDASRIPGEINRALGNAGRDADRQGAGIGRRMAAGLGGALKIGAAAAATAAGGVIATALTKGLGRLTAIDDAQGKLKGLGHDAASIAAIMDSALASVKGTAFGLGDAATVAATAVAAGIKPGQELTKYLRLIADSATIAGTGLSEMGSIINQTTTGGIVFTDTLNQLADRGIPIFTWLQNELKLTGTDFRKFVEDGKLDAATFRAAIEKNISGAALESGKTVRGALANTQAALGRAGAAALQPFFNRLAGGFGGITSLIDNVTKKIGPAAERLDAALFNRVIPGVQRMWAEFTKSDAAQFLSNALAQATGLIAGLADSARAAAPAIASIAGSLATAAGALGVGAWSVLVNLLQSVTQIANSVLVPALQAIAGLMSSNKAAVVALVAAWLAFRTIPRYMQTLGTSLAGVQTRTTAALGGIRGVATATGGVAQVAGVGATQLGRFGSAVQQMGTHAPAIARMQQAYMNAAAGADRFGRTAGAAAAGLSGVRSAASGVVSALGGPWAIAIAAASIGIVKLSSDAAKANQNLKELRDVTRDIGIARSELTEILSRTGGAFDAEALSNASRQIGIMRRDIDALSEANKPSMWDWLRPDKINERGDNKWLRDQWDAARKAIDQLKMSDEQLGAALADDTKFTALTARLNEMGTGGRFAVSELTALHDEIVRSRQLAKDSTPGFFTLSAAVKTLADESAGASDKLNAMKRALDVLSGKPVDAQAALASYNEQVRATIAVTQEWDRAQGFGEQLINAGQVDTATANGKKLFDTLNGIRDATLAAGVAGNDLVPIFAKNDQQFQQLADAVGLSKQQIIDMAASLGYLPTDITMLAKLEGADDVTQQLVVIADLLTRNREGVVIPAEALTQDARAELEKLGVTVEDLAGHPGEVRVIAKTDEALAKLQDLAQLKLPDKTQTVRLEYDLSGFSLPPSVRAKLHENIDDIPIAPRAAGGIDGPLPSQATIQYPKARLYQWAEPETGGEAFIPLAPSKRGRSLDILGQVARMFGLGLTKMADGGLVPRGVAAALAGASRVTGVKYLWGGTTEAGMDCSGFVGWLQQLLEGIAKPTQRLYTTMSLLAGATAGLKPGLGPSGTYFQVGVNSEHMAATLAGRPVESGGSHGDSRIGSPAVGATDKQFTAHFFLPNELIDGIRDAAVSAGGPTQKGKKKAKEWTEADQIDLDQAAVAVEQAKADRDEVYADRDKTDLDRRKADLAVREAQQRLLDKQAEKDGAGAEDGITPEAPPLAGRLDDDELDWERANLARDEAAQSRNEVYADPESTETDKRRADLELQAAENAIDDLRTNKDKKKTTTSTVADRIKQFGADVFGIIFDAAREQLPFGLGQSRWWDIPITTVETESGDSKKRPQRSFSDEEINQQLPVTLGNGDPRKLLEPYLDRAPATIVDWLKQLPITVHDQGGWLEPGKLALNLSNRPEPIFSSPAQLQQFMGSGVQAPPPPVQDYSVHINNPTFSDGMAAVKKATTIQERQRMRYGGRP